MDLRTDVVIAILGMAAATYLCRAGGYAVLRGLRLPGFVARMLQVLPGYIFVAYVVPGLAQGGVAAWAGAVATVVVQWRTGNFAASAVAGVSAVWLVRSLG